MEAKISRRSSGDVLPSLASKISLVPMVVVVCFVMKVLSLFICHGHFSVVVSCGDGVVIRSGGDSVGSVNDVLKDNSKQDSG